MTDSYTVLLSNEEANGSSTRRARSGWSKAAAALLLVVLVTFLATWSLQFGGEPQLRMHSESSGASRGLSDFFSGWKTPRWSCSDEDLQIAGIYKCKGTCTAWDDEKNEVTDADVGPATEVIEQRSNGIYKLTIEGDWMAGSDKEETFSATQWGALENKIMWTQTQADVSFMKSPALGNLFFNDNDGSCKAMSYTKIIRANSQFVCQQKCKRVAPRKALSK